MGQNASDSRTPGIVVLCGRSFSGGGVLVADWERTHEIARHRTRTELRAGRSVIIDDTSSPRFLRERWRDVGDRACVRVVLLHLDTPLDVSMARHAANRSDPSRPDDADQVLHEHFSGFEPPEPGEHAISVEVVSGETVGELLARIGFGS